MSHQVLIVDRRRLFAAGLVRFMNGQPGIGRVQSLLDPSSLGAVLRDCWDVVLCEEGAVEAVLGALVPPTRVAVLLDHQDTEVVSRLLLQGVAGVCVPEDRPEDVVDLVSRLMAGEIRLPGPMLGPVLAAMLRSRDERARTEEALEQLTGREREVLALLGMGLGRAEAARRLDLSPNTVRTHVQNLLHKLSLHSQLEAAAYARAMRLTCDAPPVARPR